MSTIRPGDDYDDEATKMAAEMEKDVKAALAAQAAVAPATPAPLPPTPGVKPPAVSWEESLKAVGLTTDQAQVILTSMLTQGYYERAFPIYGGRLVVRLRTRDAYCRQRVVDALDETRTLAEDVQNAVKLRLTLAGSLSVLGPDVLEHSKPGDGALKQRELFDARLARVDRIPDAMIDACYVALVHFDRAVYAALSNGAPSGF